jgi:hypothetical protein
LRHSSTERPRLRAPFGETGDELHYNVFGRNGVMGDMEPLRDRPGHELCLVVQGVTPTAEMAEELTITGTRPSGSPGEPDIFGAQQYAPLLDVEIPQSA